MSTTILLLEDDATLQDLLCEVLQDEGYHVVAADTLPHLLEVAPQKADLLITDLLVDYQMVGLQAITRMRQIVRSDLPALICTAAQQQVEMLQSEIDCLQAHLLHKPFTIDELVDEVSRALSVKKTVGHTPTPSAQVTSADSVLAQPILRTSFA